MVHYNYLVLFTFICCPHNGGFRSWENAVGEIQYNKFEVKKFPSQERKKTCISTFKRALKNISPRLSISPLYWNRGVTVLLPGWVIWKYWNRPSKFFSLGSWLVYAQTVNSQWGRRIQLIYWLKPYYKLINTALVHPSPPSADKTPSEMLYVKSFPHQPQYYTNIWIKK